ncbi:MAG: Rossmann-like domain-containing protein [Solidesulfovibrio sp. DCME]|uniref:Rossmann-like domain-containing protein n=1 Tax=Solidesulfovibrio sp. DCME TaxID=3447380 RepID=UPI003D0BBD20
MPHHSQQDILRAIADDARAVPDAAITDITTGTCLAAVSARCCGLASLVSHIAPGLSPAAPDRGSLPASARELAAALADPAIANTDAASLAMAAVNALLPPPEQPLDTPGQDIVLARGTGAKVAVIGHFPFVDDLRRVCGQVWVLEKRPRPGDVDASKAGEILPQADVVAVTGTTLLNGSLAGILSHCRDEAFVVMLGPSTPFAPSLFRFGIDVLAGCAVPDPEAALAGIRAGKCFKGLAGVRQAAWARPGLTL